MRICANLNQTMKKVLLVFLPLAFFFLFSQTAEAKVLPQARKSYLSTRAAAGSSISIYPRLRADRRALTINFANLANATAVSYLLSYKTSTQDEGAMGALNLKGSSNQSIELLFGTCSNNICRYHIDVHDAKLDISYTLKSGKKYLRKYKIKV